MKGNNVGFTSQCHPELDSGSRCLNNQKGEIPGPRTTTLRGGAKGNAPVWDDNPLGFTLIELLVVVLIIGVLTAIALPQYQKAVMKSRLTGLMPVAKAVRDGNEAYRLAYGKYADAPGSLDVSVPNNDETIITLSKHSAYNYTKATAKGIQGRNNLIMYQKKSKNFPREIHCEAKNGDGLAESLCRDVLHATQELGWTVTPGFNTFVVEGTGNGDVSNGIKLVSYGANKIPVVKAVRAALGLGLSEAKALVLSAPCVIGKNLSVSELQALKAAIEEAGGEAEYNSVEQGEEEGE